MADDIVKTEGPQAWGWMDWALIGLHVLLCLAFFWRQLFLGEVWHSMDFAPQIYPHLQWVHEKLAKGLAPAWSQDLSLGYPFLDEGLSGYFYLPMRALLHFFDAPRAIALLYLFHFWLAGFGAYLFARRLELDPFPALLAAVSASFGGGMVYSLHHYANACSLAWLPWHFLGLELALSKKKREGLMGSLLLGISFAGGATGGHLVITVYGALALAVYAWFRLRGGFFSGIFKLIARAPLALVFFAMLALPQLLMTRRLVGQSVRQAAFSYEYSAIGSLSPLALLQAAAPFALGHPNDNSYLGAYGSLGAWIPQGLFLYAGLAVLLLAVLAWFSEDRRASGFGWAMVVLIAYALGSWTPIHRLFFELPLFSHFRAPMKAANLSPFLLGMLGSLGLQSLLHQKIQWKSLLILAAVAGILLAGLSAGLHFGKARLAKSALPRIEARAALSDASAPKAYYVEKFERWRKGAARHFGVQAGLALGLALFAALAWLLGPKIPEKFRALALGLPLGLLAFGELFAHGHAYFPTLAKGFYAQVPPTVEGIQKASKGKAPFRIFGWGWSDLLKKASSGGVEGADLKAATRIAALLSDGRTLGYGLSNFRGYSPLPIAEVDALLGDINDFHPGQTLKQQTLRLKERREQLDLGGVRYLLSSVDLDWPGLKRLKKGEVRLYENLRARPLAWLEEGGSLKWLERTDEAWALEAVVRGEGRLRLSRAHYEGIFEARVDGKKASLDPEGAFSSVHLGPGRHKVEIRLKDPLLPWGQAFFLAAHLILALAALSLLFSREKPAHAPA